MRDSVSFSTGCSRIEGTLTAITDGRAHLQCEHLTYEVLVPAADQQRMATLLEQSVVLHTLHYLEGSGQGANFTPRLVGFATLEDRAFFELFTTVKGIGNRKALRCLALPFTSIAEAIASRDADLLKSLPEIGKRLAETIIAELHGKVDRFVELKPGMDLDAGIDPEQASLINDAAAVLVQLGENQLQARQLVQRAAAADPTIDTPDALVAAAFRIKAIL